MNYALRHAALVTYMQAKIAEKDWHAVSDAANDLREIEAEERACGDAAVAELREILSRFKNRVAAYAQECRRLGSDFVSPV